MMLYHFTFCENLPFIRRDGVLLSAATLLDKCGAGDEKTQKRSHRRVLPCGRVLRDQPIHAGNIDFAPGFGMADLLALINGHVFFWPKFKEHFANKYGDNALIRCRLADLEKTNPKKTTLCCRYNSGAPRMSGGKKSPRGPNLFEPLSGVAYCKVVEVAFHGDVRLPDNYEVFMPDEWRKLKEQGGI